MAKIERTLKGSFDSLLSTLNSGILTGSMSATLQGSSDFNVGGIRCAVRVYEKYSMMSKSRISANITLLSNGEELFLSIIAAGGSSAAFFKVNTWTDQAFADKIEDIALAWEQSCV